MTANPSVAFHDMDSLQPDDTMDLASSPFRQADDLDLDLDQMREPSPEPNLDSMFDDNFDDPSLHPDSMEEESNENLHDDEMVDEDTVIQHLTHGKDDLNMEAFLDHGGEVGDDEDILYEEDEAEVPPEAASKSEQDLVQTVNPKTNQESFPVLEKTDQAAPPAYEPEDQADHQIDANIEQTPETEQDIRGVDQGQDEPTDPVDRGITQQQDLHAFVDNDNIVESAPVDSALDFLPMASSGQALGIDTIPSDSQDDGQDAIPEIDGGYTHQETDHIIPAESGVAATEEPHLHPIKVIYQDSEMCLFPPTHNDHSDTFFLSDTNLAYENLDKLLAACRDILAGTIGDDDELVLDVASLGLHICEDSKYAAQITLSQILDVYLALSHNGTVESVDPLYCTLTSRVCLASQYAYLTASAQEGKTFTEISTEHLGSPDESEDELEDDNKAQISESVFPPAETVGESDRPDGDAALPSEPWGGESVEQATAGEEQTYLHDEAEETYEAAADDELDHHDHQDGGQPQDQAQSIGASIPDEQSNPAEPQQNVQDADAESGAIEEAAFETSADSKRADIKPSSAELGEAEEWSEDRQAPVDGTEPSHEPGSDEILDNASVHDETNSSHTVEGDQDEIPHESHANEEFLAYDDDHEDTTGARSNLEDEETADLQADGHYQNGGIAGKKSENGDRQDDFLDLEIDQQNHDDQAHDNVFVEDEAEPEDLFSESDTVDNSETPVKHETSLNGHTVSQTPTPLTPSKGNSSKRKVLDDDTLDFIDLGTPDPKRRRPS